MEHYYTNKKNISENGLVILDEEAHHLKNVLRKKTGDEIFVTDGERNLYKTRISGIEKDKILCRIEVKYYDLNEPKRKIHLYLALLKNPSRFEFAIEKAVEIGVNEITPLITEHVINKKTNKVERWQSIALSAIKQSQRCYLPAINKPVPFKTALQQLTLFKNSDKQTTSPSSLPDDKAGMTGGAFLADEKENSKTSFSLLSNDISLFIGPEGGFSNEEVESAEECGIQIISLGKRKLRSETAAILGVSKLIDKD